METLSTPKHPAAGKDQDECGFPLVSWSVDKARMGHGPRFADHLSRVERGTIIRKPMFSLQLLTLGTPTATSDSGLTLNSFPSTLLPTPSPKKEKVPGKDGWKMGSD